ncbi:MAG: DNA-binding protein [Bacteroidales bacterium]|nr:DNA-binding protein [Bacteroidales bacterium]
MYSYKELSQGYYVLSLDNHVEIMEALAAFCGEKNILAGKISGLGATNDATFRYLNPSTMKYVDKTFAEQMEITNLIGNISEKDGKPYLHVHVTASRSDNSCIGGHLLSARINGACELFVKTFPEPIHRRHDPTTGLNMYQL